MDSDLLSPAQTDVTDELDTPQAWKATPKPVPISDQDFDEFNNTLEQLRAFGQSEPSTANVGHAQSGVTGDQRTVPLGDKSAADTEQSNENQKWLDKDATAAPTRQASVEAKVPPLPTEEVLRAASSAQAKAQPPKMEMMDKTTTYHSMATPIASPRGQKASSSSDQADATITQPGPPPAPMAATTKQSQPTNFMAKAASTMKSVFSTVMGSTSTSTTPTQMVNEVWNESDEDDSKQTADIPMDEPHPKAIAKRNRAAPATPEQVRHAERKQRRVREKSANSESALKQAQEEHKQLLLLRQLNEAQKNQEAKCDEIIRLAHTKHNELQDVIAKQMAETVQQQRMADEQNKAYKMMLLEKDDLQERNNVLVEYNTKLEAANKDIQERMKLHSIQSQNQHEQMKSVHHTYAAAIGSACTTSNDDARGAHGSPDNPATACRSQYTTGSITIKRRSSRGCKTNNDG